MVWTRHGRIDKKTLALLQGLESKLAGKHPTGTPPPAPMPTNTGNNQGSVHGNFVDKDGAPIVGAAISLFAQRVRDRAQLTSTTTDGSGAFVLTYQRIAPSIWSCRLLPPSARLPPSRRGSSGPVPMLKSI